MLKLLKALLLQKNQLIKDIKNTKMRENFKGRPEVNFSICTGCNICGEGCPSNAIEKGKIDLGKCVFCLECERNCPQSVIKFTANNKMGATIRENLIINDKIEPIKAKEEINRVFGHSLKLRQVSAGGCNSCEMELNATSNANFDMGRFGIEFVASPRHADGIVITGPITKNMAKALEDTYQAIPEPKIIILVGTCAISGGIYQNSAELNRDFLQKHKIDLYIPGCPPHPLVIINAILDFIKK